MSMKPTTRNARWWFACAGLACLAVAGQSEPAAAQPGEPKTLQQRIALAERQVAVKQAAVKIADAQMGVAEAKVIIAKASIQAARAAVNRWEAEANRGKQLQAKGVFDMATLETTQSQLASAKASLAEAEGKILLAEREVAVEEARRQLAEAELAEAQLRLEQLGGKAPQPLKKADALPALRKARLDLAKKGYQEASSALTEVKRPAVGLNIPQAKPQEVYDWSVRWLEAQRAMSDKKEDRIAGLEGHLKRMKGLERRVKQLTPDIFPKTDGTAAAFWVAEAEIWLADANGKSDQSMLKNRLDLAKKGFDEALRGLTAVKRVYVGPIYFTLKPGEAHAWSIRWMSAEREMGGKGAEAVDEHLERMKKLEQTVRPMAPEFVHPADVSAAAFWVAEAEIWLAGEKAK